MLPDAGIRNARALALFTIGETPWSASQRALILDRVRAGALSVVAIHSATDCLLRLGRLRRARRRPLRRPSVDTDVHRRRARHRHIPRARTSATAWEWHDEVYQFRDLRPDARGARCACATANSISTRRARARRRSATRSRGASPKARAACSPPASVTSRARGRARPTCGISRADWSGRCPAELSSRRFHLARRRARRATGRTPRPCACPRSPPGA